jgi:hypothetical protein
MTGYTPRIDVDAITALDVHTHVESDGHGHYSLDQELLDASAAYFRGDHNRTPTVDDLAAYYRERNMAAVVFTIDAATGLGHAPLSSEEIAEKAAEHADVLVPFGSVDPTPAIPRSSRRGAWSRSTASAGSSSTPASRPSHRTPPSPGRCGRRWRSWAPSRCSTPARPASAPASPAVAGSSSATPTRSCSTTSRPTSPSSRS